VIQGCRVESESQPSIGLQMRQPIPIAN